MNIPKALQIVPYITILLANILYLYYFSSFELFEWYQLFLFNFIMMVLIGIFLVIKINLLLHQWLVVEGQQDQKGKPTKKSMIKNKIKYYIKKAYLIDSIFLPGNQKIFLKIYFGLTALRYLQSFIPGILLTLLTTLFYQYKDIIYPKIKPIIIKGNQLFDRFCTIVLNYVPKYKDIKSRLSAQTNTSHQQHNYKNQ